MRRKAVSPPFWCEFIANTNISSLRRFLQRREESGSLFLKGIREAAMRLSRAGFFAQARRPSFQSGGTTVKSGVLNTAV